MKIQALFLVQMQIPFPMKIPQLFLVQMQRQLNTMYQLSLARVHMVLPVKMCALVQRQIPFPMKIPQLFLVQMPMHFPGRMVMRYPLGIPSPALKKSVLLALAKIGTPYLLF